MLSTQHCAQHILDPQFNIIIHYSYVEVKYKATHLNYFFDQKYKIV